MRDSGIERGSAGCAASVINGSNILSDDDCLSKSGRAIIMYCHKTKVNLLV